MQILNTVCRTQVSVGRSQPQDVGNGLAFGFDRLVTLLLGLEDIRDVIAFPKVQNASELMSKAPGLPDAGALEELGLAVIAKEENE